MITEAEAIRTHRLKLVKSDKKPFIKEFECKVCGLIFEYYRQFWYVKSNKPREIPTCKEYVMQEALG